MADPTPQNTQKDPVTGEMVSKKCALLYPFTTNFFDASRPIVFVYSELKKREKAREREAKRAAASAAKPALANKPTAGPKEDELTPNVAYLTQCCLHMLIIDFSAIL